MIGYDFRNLEVASRAILFFASLGVLQSSLEWLALFPEFKRGGIYDWTVIGLLHKFTSTHYTGSLLAVAGCRSVVGACLLIRIAAAGWCILSSFFAHQCVSWTPVCILAVTGLYLNYRICFGLEGADQMLNIIFISISLRLLAQEKLGDELAVCFIGVQSTLSYFAAGISKLFGNLWRKGDAVRLVVNTRSFGHLHVARILNRRPILGKIATFAVLIIECSFPLAIVLPYPVILGYIIVLFAFHLANGVVLGLNVFIWAYLATFPAIVFTADKLRAMR